MYQISSGYGKIYTEGAKWFGKQIYGSTVFCDIVHAAPDLLAGPPPKYSRVLGMYD
jgi:hypothetical protein